MITDDYSAVLNQIALMSRDPLIYLAIDEKSGSFTEDETIAIRIAKAFALLGTLRLDDAMAFARENQMILVSTNRPHFNIINYFVIMAVASRQNNLKLLHECLQNAKKLFNNGSSMELQVWMSYLNLAGTFDQMNRNQLQEELQQMIASLDKVEHPVIRTMVLRIFGRIYMEIRQYEMAQNYLIAAYDAAQGDHFNIFLLEICNDLVATCGMLSQFERAERFFGQAQALIEQLRVPFFRVYLFYNYGLAKFRQKDHRAAVLFFRNCIEHLEQSGLDYGRLEFKAYLFLAKALHQMDEEDKALEYWLLAEERISLDGADEMQAEISLNIALAQIKTKNWDDALRRLKKAITHYHQFDNYDRLLEATRILAFCYLRRKDYPRALAVQRKVDIIAQKYIDSIAKAQRTFDDKTFNEIIGDNKKLREKYDTLLYEVSRRQAARFRGNSPVAKRVIDSALLAAMHLEANILLHGESGSGKGILAQMIHFSSDVKNMPFIKVNCAAIAADNFDAEFFGTAAGYHSPHEPGQLGYFAKADTGTLYLDEITEIPQEFQHKLLSILDAKSYSPLGKSSAKAIQCRIISSTNKDILELLKQQKFSMELLHRLNTLEIDVPPLRDRKDDIPMLVEGFASEFARETSKRYPKIKESFFKRLSSYDFPGNTRELRNIIERIFILHYNPVWNAEILENIDVFRRDKVLRGSLLEHKVEEFDRERIIEALHKTGGKQKTAAKLLNMTESTLCRKIKRYNIK